MTRTAPTATLGQRNTAARIAAALAVAFVTSAALPDYPVSDRAPVGIVVTLPDGNVFVPSTADECATAWDHFDADQFPAGRAVCLPLDTE